MSGTSTDIQYVTSRDGTRIAYRATGEGMPLVLVDGALGVGTDPGSAALGAPLATDHLVVAYDRRGRGASGDTKPYAVAREVEDIEALIDAVGGRALLFGISSGAALALRAADTLGDKVTQLAVYEPPFILDDSRTPLPADYVGQLDAACAAGNPGGAVTLFMTAAVGIPEEYVTAMRDAPAPEADDGLIQAPSWADMEKIAHTLAYDGRIVADMMAGRPLPADPWPHITAPTLAVSGGESEPFMHTAAEAVADRVRGARHATLEGQSHQVAPEALAPLLREFFTQA